MKIQCQFCTKITAVKQGYRNNKTGKKQKYQCLDCNQWFVEDDGFKKMRYPPNIIVLAIHLHNDGLSLFQVKNILWQHHGINVTRRTISQWTKKYSTFLKSGTYVGANAAGKTAL